MPLRSEAAFSFELYNRFNNKIQKHERAEGDTVDAEGLEIMALDEIHQEADREK